MLAGARFSFAFLVGGKFVGPGLADFNIYVRAVPICQNCSIIFCFGLALQINYWPLYGLALVGTSYKGARKKSVYHKPHSPQTSIPMLLLF